MSWIFFKIVPSETNQIQYRRKKKQTYAHQTENMRAGAAAARMERPRAPFQWLYRSGVGGQGAVQETGGGKDHWHWQGSKNPTSHLKIDPEEKPVESSLGTFFKGPC